MTSLFRTFAAAGLVAASALLLPAVARAAGPAIGQMAPEFSLPDQNGVIHHLRDSRGHVTILAFYPKDFTAG